MRAACSTRPATSARWRPTSAANARAGSRSSPRTRRRATCCPTRLPPRGARFRRSASACNLPTKARSWRSSRAAATSLRELSALPLVSYESSRRPESSLQRAFASAGLPMQLAMTAHDADLIKTYVRAGLGVGILAEMALSPDDTDLRALPAPDALPGCITWAVLPRGRVLRDFTVRLLRELAPQIDAIDLRRVVAGNAEPAWPEPPAWSNMPRL